MRTESCGLERCAPHSCCRVSLRHWAVVQVGSSQATKDSGGTGGSPGAKEGPWRIRTVGTTRTTETQVGVVGKANVMASVDASASNRMMTGLAVATAPGETAVRSMRRSFPSARLMTNAALTTSTGCVMTRAVNGVVMGAQVTDGLTAAAGGRGASATTPRGRRLGTGGMIVEVARRSVSAFPNPASRTTSSPQIWSEAPGTSCAPWAVRMPRTLLATW